MSTFRRRALAAAWMVSLVAGVAGVGVIEGRAQVASGGLTQVASTDLPESMAGDNTTPMIDVKARRVFLPCASCGTGADPNDVLFYVFDADTGHQVGVMRRGTVTRSYLGRGFAVDPDHGVLYQMALGGSAFTDDPGNVDLQQLWAFDTHTQALIAHVAMPGVMGGSVGLYYSSADRLLYAVGADPQHNSSVTDGVVKAIDPVTLAVRWSTSLGTKCKAPAHTWSQTVLGEVTIAGSSYLYTVCQIQPFSSAEGVVRVTLPPSPGTSSGTLALPVDVYPGLVAGNGGGTDSVFVPSSGRIVTTVSNVDYSAFGVYVFDPQTNSYVAAPTLFSRGSDRYVQITQPSLGVDPVSGRVYSASWKFSGTFDSNGNRCTAYVPSSAAFATAEANLDSNSASVAPLADQTFEPTDQYTVAFDPVTRNLWTMDHPRDPSKPCDATSANAYQHVMRLVVFHDDSPPAARETSRNWDSGTRDVSGAAAVGFAAASQASSYGVQYDVTPTGIDGVLNETNAIGCDSPQTQFQGWADAVSGPGKLHSPSSPPLPAAYHAMCNGNPREVTFAHVSKTSLDASEATAEAVAADASGGTARDMQTATDVSQPAAYPTTSAGYVAGLCQVADITASQCSTVNVMAAVCQQDGIAADQCSVAALTAKGCADHGVAQATPAPNATADPGADSQRALCRLALPYLTGQQMPFTPAPCSDNGTSPQVSGPHHTDQLKLGGSPFAAPANTPGWSEVTCSYTGMVAEGEASTDTASIGLPVSVHSATADAVSQRDMPNGSEAKADSVVTGIDVPGVLHIGRLEVHGLTRAYGKAGSNAATYSCTVSDVTIDMPGGGSQSLPSSAPALPVGVPSAPSAPAGPPPPQIRIPGTTSCSDPDLLADVEQLNQQLEGTLQVEFPRPARSTDAGVRDDEVVVRVSPRGYIAEVAPSTVRVNQDDILLDERTLEEPALVITYIGDTQSRHSRFVTRIGGIAASSRYGLFPLDDAGGDDGATLSTDGGSQQPPESGTTGVVGPDGITPALTPVTPGSPGGGGIPGALRRLAQAVVEGINVLLQHPGLIPPLLAVWLMLGLPGYMVNRRRVLLAATGGR